MPRRGFRFFKRRIAGRPSAAVPVRNYLQVFVELTSLVAGLSLIMSVIVLQASFQRFGLDFLTAASIEDVAIGGFRIFVEFVWFLLSLNGLWLLLVSWLILRLAQVVAAALSLRLGRRLSVVGLTLALLLLVILARARFLQPVYAAVDSAWDRMRGDCCVTAWPIDLWPFSLANAPSFLLADLFVVILPLLLAIGLLLGERTGRMAWRLTLLGRSSRAAVLPFLFAALAAPDVHARAMRFHDLAAGRVTNSLPDLQLCRGLPVYVVWSGSRSDLLSCRRGGEFHRYLVIRGQGLNVAVGEQDFQRGAADLLGGQLERRRSGSPNVLP